MENIEKQHLEYFKVENFKGLESLELNDIKQFNIILGDNNVGKTSVLEALLFDNRPFIYLSNQFEIFASKGNIKNYDPKINYFNFFNGPQGNKINYSFQFNDSNIENIDVSEIDSNTLELSQISKFLVDTFVSPTEFPKKVLQFKQGEENSIISFDFNLHRSKFEENYLPYIKSGLVYQNDLVDFFSKNINTNPKLKKEFIENLAILSDDIYDITIDTTTIPENQILVVLFNDEKKPLPLFMMGDGTIRLVRLILEIIICKNRRLMIDEIDNGMHFSRMKKVWEVLLKVADKNNTQLFITTHDSECLRAFKEVLETEELTHLQDDVASYTLKKNEHEIKAVLFNFQEFENAIDFSLNIRG